MSKTIVQGIRNGTEYEEDRYDEYLWAHRHKTLGDKLLAMIGIYPQAEPPRAALRGTVVHRPLRSPSDFIPTDYLLSRVPEAGAPGRPHSNVYADTMDADKYMVYKDYLAIFRSLDLFSFAKTVIALEGGIKAYESLSIYSLLHSMHGRLQGLFKLFSDAAGCGEIAAVKEALRQYGSVTGEIHGLLGMIRHIALDLDRFHPDIPDNRSQSIIIRLMNPRGTLDDFVFSLECIQSAYRQITCLMGIDYVPLKIVRIESGSLLADLRGDRAAKEVFERLLLEVTRLLHQVFTLSGRIARQRQVYDYLMDFITRPQGLPLSGGVKEEIEAGVSQTLMILAQNLRAVALSSSKVQIGDREIMLDDALSQKYLSESKTLRLESGDEPPGHRKEVENAHPH